MSWKRAIAPMWVSILSCTFAACSGEPSHTQSSSAGASATAGGTTSTAGGTTSTAGGTTSTAGGTTSTAGGPVACRSKGDGKSTISFVNQCQGTLSFHGSKIEGGGLLPGAHACRDVGNTSDEIPAIRFWGFIGI